MERIAETSPRLKARGKVSLNWHWETRLWSLTDRLADCRAVGGNISRDLDE
jgi:hypothetical protein